MTDIVPSREADLLNCAFDLTLDNVVNFSEALVRQQKLVTED